MSQPDYLRTYGARRGANVGPSRTCCYVAGTRPYGDDPFCGQKSVPGYSYCAEHKAVCLVSADPVQADNMVRGAMKIVGAE